MAPTRVDGRAGHQHACRAVQPAPARGPGRASAPADGLTASRRRLLVGAVVAAPLLAGGRPSRAVELSLDIDPKADLLKGRRSSRDLINAADSTFAESDLLRALREKTASNRSKSVSLLSAALELRIARQNSVSPTLLAFQAALNSF